MARPLSGKKSQQDENAIRQLDSEIESSRRYWIKEASVRLAFLEQNPLRHLKKIEEVLLFALYYLNHNKEKYHFSEFVQYTTNSTNYKKLKPETYIIFSKILYKMRKNIYDYAFQIQSILDTALSLREENPVKSYGFIDKCDDFYIKNIFDELLEMIKICRMYGLYPHQFINQSSIIILSKIKKIEEAQLFHNFPLFIIDYDPEPPILFKHRTQEKSFFETEKPDKCYYYWHVSKTDEVKDVSENVLNTLKSFIKRDGSYSENHYEKNASPLVQICIDPFMYKDRANQYTLHLKLEIAQTWSYYWCQAYSFNYLNNVGTEQDLYRLFGSLLLTQEGQELLSSKIKFEHLQAQIKNTITKGIHAKANPENLLCGMYIWDLTHFYGIPYKLTEGFLASDTKKKGEAVENFYALEIKPNNTTNPKESIEKIRNTLTELGCVMTRKALHQNYTNFKKMVVDSRKHPLWR